MSVGYSGSSFRRPTKANNIKMPYGAIMTQSVLSSGREDAHDNRLPRSSRLPEGLPSGSRSSKNRLQQSTTHFHGEERGTSGSAGFAGVMRALLKPSAGASASSRGRGEGPQQAGFQPRTALDLSGHSFSKQLKEEISRSKQNVALKSKSVHTNSNNHAEASTHWWEKNTRRWGDLDDKGLSRVSSSSTIPPSPPSSFSSAAPPDVHAYANAAAHGGGYHDMRPAGAYQQQQHHQQHQRHQQMGSVYRSRSFDDMSLAVGMQ